MCPSLGEMYLNNFHTNSSRNEVVPVGLRALHQRHCGRISQSTSCGSACGSGSGNSCTTQAHATGLHSSVPQLPSSPSPTCSSRRRQTVTETVTTSARTPLALVRLHLAIRIFVPFHSHSLSPVSPPRRHGCKSFGYR